MLAKDDVDNSGALTLLGSGLTISQSAAALSAEVGPGAFTLDAHTLESITATGQSGETFDFASGFGGISIAGFLAGGAAHDNSSWFAGDATEAQEALSLLNHATGAISTVITDTAGDALTLLGVTKSTLSSNLGDIGLS